MNVVNLIGYVTSAPIVKKSEGGRERAKFKLSCTKDYTDSAGKRTKTVNVIQCVAYDNNARIVETLVHENQRLFVSGGWTVGTYTDEDGKRQQTNELEVSMMAAPLNIRRKELAEETETASKTE